MLPEQFATADDGTPLLWIISRAPGGSSLNPRVLLFYGGHFRSGDPGQVTKVCAPALNAAGFDCYAPEYRLAPPGHLASQISLGRYPDQTNDVALAVAAASDGRPIFVLGGSAGGAHTLFPGAISPSVHAVVAISPATQFDDPQSLKDLTFSNTVNNYAPGQLSAASPNANLTASTKPVLLCAFTTDHMPSPQYQLCLDLLINLNIEHEALLLPGSGHSYPDAWPIMKDQAIAFFNAHL